MAASARSGSDSRTLAAGAGAGSRRSLGTAVVGGLALATVLIIFVPIFYYVLERLREGWSKTRGQASSGQPGLAQASAVPEAAPGSD